VAHDHFVADGNEVEPIDLGISGPDGLNYVDLILLVVIIAGEGSTNHPEDRWPVRLARRPNNYPLSHRSAS
jgi:hypothetical protein